VTGGLGPTEDDRTREALARWSEMALVENAEAWASIQAYFDARGIALAGSNERQALLPAGATLLPNRVGTAPGFSLCRNMAEGRVCEIFVLPGVPSEMRVMFEEQVLPRIEDRGIALTQRTLAFGGVSEARLGQLFAEHLTEGGDLRVGMCAEFGLIRVTARGYGPQATARIETLFGELRRLGSPWLLGEGEGALEDFLVCALEERGWTLTLAESCTAGLVASRLGNVSGLSKVLGQSFVTYADEAKRELLGVPVGLIETEGAVSKDCALAMAQGARKAARADLAGAITGIAGPEGGSPEKPVGTVHLAVASRERLWHVERHFGNPGRQIVRNRASIELLLLLQKAVRGEGGEPLDSPGAS